ncbi:MAG: trigger factor [Gammaproteobacteria bacterium]
MQISTERTGPLERRIIVRIPEERIAGAVEKRLGSMTRTAKVKGFRVGKVPLGVLRQRYGGGVRQEVIDTLIRSSYQEALKKEHLHPASDPEIQLLSGAAGDGCSYQAVIEVFPEVQVRPLETLVIEAPRCRVSDEDVDRAIDDLRRRKRRWEVVDRPSQSGDRVEIDFRGILDGETFEGGVGSKVQLELGAGAMLPDFESGITGVASGGPYRMEVGFPRDYHDPKLAGRTVPFEITVHEVARAVWPAVDEAFCRDVGVAEGGVEGLRASVRHSLEQEGARQAREVLKRTVMQTLIDVHPIDLPKFLVEREAQRLLQDRAAKLQVRLSPAQQAQDAKHHEPQARWRVAVGLIMGEVVRQAGLRAPPAEVRALVDQIAATYEEPGAVVRWYYEDARRLQGVEALVLEQRALDWVLSKAQVREVDVGFDDLMKPRQTEGGTAS